MRSLGDTIKEGDVILSNHPSAGGSHLPDLTVITPVSSTVYYSSSIIRLFVLKHPVGFYKQILVSDQVFDVFRCFTREVSVQCSLSPVADIMPTSVVSLQDPCHHTQKPYLKRVLCLNHSSW